MMFLWLWSCSLPHDNGAEDQAPAIEPEAAMAEEAKQASFDPLPEGVELILEPARFHQQISPYGLGPSLARHARSVQYNTDILVAQMAAARSGAELGALMVEAGFQDPQTITARLQRIHDGMKAIRDDGPILDLLVMLQGTAESGISGEAWVQVLQAQYSPIRTHMADHLGTDVVPLLLAGAWMQGALLSVKAMREKDQLGIAPALLNRPEVGLYFERWMNHAGPEMFSDSAVADIQQSLLTLRALSDNDPMTPADAATIEKNLEGLLGML